MRWFVAAALAMSVSAHADTKARPFPYEKWTALVAANVDDRGRVQYGKVDRAALNEVLNALAASSPRTDPASYPTKAAALSYWIDGYNAAMWANVIARPTMKSIDQTIFHATSRSFGGQALTQNDVENIVRKLGDPRVHMALNCASGSCPRLPREAFTPDKLDAQLDQAAKTFCNDARNVSYDSKTKTVALSKIFEWYADDFSVGAITFVNRYAASKIPADAHIRYVPYDWHLNDGSR